MLDQPVLGFSIKLATAIITEYLPFVHQEDVWPARHIGVNRHWENELVVLAVEVIEVITPDILNIPTLGVRHTR